MNPSEQRIAIAEWCGYTDIRMSTSRSYDRDYEGGWNDFEGDREGYPRSQLPDYINDLNAMHGALETLTSDGLWSYFISNLSTVLNADGQPETTRLFMLINASSEERAKALLMTIGKWTYDSP